MGRDRHGGSSRRLDAANITEDDTIIAAVNEMEVLTSDLARKIWQKITSLSQLDERDVPTKA